MLLQPDLQLQLQQPTTRLHAGFGLAACLYLSLASLQRWNSSIAVYTFATALCAD